MKKAFFLALTLLTLGSLSHATTGVPKKTDAASSETIVTETETSFVQDLQASTPDIRKSMEYKELKIIYDPAEYIRDVADPYNSGVAGVCSFLIPGLGQILDGEVGRGLLFFVGASATTGLGIATSQPSKTLTSSGWVNDPLSGRQLIFALACYAGALAIDIWAITDAIKVAKVKNMYNQDLRKLFSSNIDIKVSPSLAYVPDGNSVSPVAGIAVRFVF